MTTQSLTNAQLNFISSIFKALADPTRLKIIHLLANNECSVGAIAEELALSQSATSHQLSFLKSLKLVKSRRNGNSILYSCDDEHVISLLMQAIEHSNH